MNNFGLSLHLVSSHAAAVYFSNLSSGICWPGLVHRVRSKVSVTRTVPCGRKSSSIGMAHCSFGRGCFRIMRLMCSNFFIIVCVVSEFVARSVFDSARGCPRFWSFLGRGSVCDCAASGVVVSCAPGSLIC